MNKVICRTENLEKAFNVGSTRVNALNGVNLAVEGGEFVSIIGPSGSGKTTLLNLVGCIDRPSRGTVFFKNNNVALLSERELDSLRLNEMGFIFQTFNLLPNLSAEENVVLPMAITGMKEKPRISRARELLSRMGLAPRIHHKPRELSAGESQRVAIARALANRPSLLLADEPTGNLDSHTTREITMLLKELNSEHGLSILLVTHDRSVASIAHRTLRMVDGQFAD